MTLKAIMYAIGYGEGISKLKRKEGARRVKQALVKLQANRNKTKLFTFGDRFGVSNKALEKANRTCLGIERMHQDRKMAVGETFRVLYGSRFADVSFEGIEDQLKAQGYKDTH